MANYINIGSSCANFDYEPSSKPTASLTGVYIINGGTGMPLKDTPAPTAAQTQGFASAAITSYTGGSNSYNIADNEFKVWYNENLSRFTSDRQDWRYLTEPTASAPVYSDTSENSGLNNQTIVTAGGASWPTQTTINGGSSFAGIQVTHPANGGSNFFLVNSSNVLMYTYANTQIVTLPSPINYAGGAQATIGIDSTPVFYLYNKNNDIRYLTYNGTAFGVSDTNTVSATPPTDFYMTRVRSGTRIFIALATGTPGSGTVVTPTSDGVAVLSNFEIQVTSSTPNVAGTYRITTINPSLGENPAGFPTTESTLFKHLSTGKYLYWTGTGLNSAITSPAVFDLKDFWSSGLSANQIIQGMQFKFQDMTVTSNASASGSATVLDWYHWKVVTDTSQAPSFSNTSNVAVTRFGSNTWVLGSPSGQFFGNQITSTDVVPSKFEGWSIIGPSGTTSNALVYMRVPQAGGVPVQVGYLTVSSGNPTFVQSTTSPLLSGSGGTPTANAWMCYKCTSASGQYCSPYSSGGSSSPKALGSISSVQILTENQLSITIGSSGLSVNDPISFRILLSGTPVSLAGGQPTVWVEGGTFTVTIISSFVVNSTYTIEFNSQAALVIPQNTSTTYRIPYFAGLTTISTTMNSFNFAFDYNDNRLFAIFPGTSVIRTISLNSPYTVSDYVGLSSTSVLASATTSVTDGSGSTIVLRHLVDIFLMNGATNAYFIDAGRVRSITHPTASSSAAVVTIAGAGGAINNTVSGDGTGASVTFGNIRNISASSDPNYIFVTDTQTSTLKRIGISSGVIGQVFTILGGPFSGTQFGTPGSTDGSGNLFGLSPATSTGRLNGPTGLVYTVGDGTSSGSIYICDTENNAIRLFNIANNQLTTVAGSLSSAGNTDGTVGTSRLTRPTRIAYVTGTTLFYFLDGSPSSMIKRLDTSTNTVTTVVTSGSSNVIGRFQNITYIDRPGASKGRFVVSAVDGGTTRTYLLTFL